MLDLTAFKESIHNDEPSEGLSDLLQALWWDSKENWTKAHEIAQSVTNSDGAWVHAYLHRKEGDRGNANYWYSRAGRPMSSLSLQEEWEEIVKALIRVE